MNRDEYLTRAAYYGLWMRQRGHGKAEAARLVIEKYPHTRALLESLTFVDPNRPGVQDPLRPEREDKSE